MAGQSAYTAGSEVLHAYSQSFLQKATIHMGTTSTCLNSRGSTRALRICTVALIVMGCTSTPWGLAAEAEQTSLDFKVSGSQPVGGEGSWDYADYDSVHQRLFVARVGGVLVLDGGTLQPVGTVPALAGTRTHGVTFAPDLGLGLTSNGSDETSTVFNLGTLEPVRRITLGHSPDAIVYDPVSRRGVGLDGDDNVAVPFDPLSGSVSPALALPGSPEGAAADGRGHLYVNLSDRNEVAEIDTRRWAVEGHWSIGGGCKEPTPLAIDRGARRLFIACRSGVLAIVDPVKRALITTVPIGKGADAVAYEPKSRLIFVSCYDGTLTVVEAGSPAKYRVLETIKTAPGARTLALDPVRLRVFLPVADLGPVLPKVGSIPGRPAIVPATFRILTVSRSGLSR
jgi:DNA-binding beta-propeller fold protein YncE